MTAAFYKRPKYSLTHDNFRRAHDNGGRRGGSDDDSVSVMVSVSVINDTARGYEQGDETGKEQGGFHI
jgi:hypothetical protein